MADDVSLRLLLVLTSAGTLTVAIISQEQALIEFARGVEWEKYEDDHEVIDILKKIKKRAEEMDEGDDEEEIEKRAKVVIVGDGAVGKTCLFVTYAKGKFPEEYVPTVFDNFTHETKFKGEPFLLHMWDTAGQEDYDRLRPLSYPGTDVVLLCFSLVNESTFESVREKWNPEINHYMEGIPKILVGTKLDMREQKITDGALTKYEEITTEEGQELAEEIGATAYIETSPLTGKNLMEVFERVIQAALDNKEEEEEEVAEVKPSSSKKSSKSSEKKSEKKEEGESKKKHRKKKSDKEDGEHSEKKKRKKKSSSKHRDETSEERRERRRKRREEKEARAEKKSKKKSEDGEKKKKRRKKDKDGEEGEKKKRKKKLGIL